jgi:sporulation-control protein spo0M
MGFLDKVKAAAGVGTANLEVDVKARPEKRGDNLEVVLRVIGGKQPQKMNYLVYELRYEGTWTVKTADGVDLTLEGKAKIQRVQIEAANNLGLEPGKKYEYPLSLRIPADGPVSGPTLKYVFGARADIEGSQDPQFHTEFEVKG